MTARPGRFVSAACGTVVLSIGLLVAASPAAAQQSAMRDGIKVHGHWTIDVKNADGTLASHNEFENALEGTGQVVLARLLSSQLTPIGWEVFSMDANGFFGAVIQDQAAAAVLHPSEPTLSTNLTVDALNSPNQSQMVMQGSVTAASALQIASVATAFVFTWNSQPDSLEFTKHTLPQPVTVVANQIIQISVVISFS